MRIRLLIVSIFAWTQVLTALRADPFVFGETNAPPDTLLAFRQQGSSFEMVVNIGTIERYSKAAAGEVIEISEYSSNQLSGVVSSLNAVSWSVSAALKPTLPKLVDYPVKTLWVTRPRSNRLVEAQPWERKSQFTQASSESRITSFGVGTEVYSSLHLPGPKNTVTAVVMPSDYGSGYSAFMGTGNLKNTFQGVIENTTPNDFEAAGLSSRSDLFELLPGAGPGRRLGYFELQPKGTLHFVAAGGGGEVDVVPPTVISLTPAPGIVTNLGRIQVVFSEPVIGVDAGDLVVNGQSAISVSGNGASWDFELPAGLSGTVNVTWNNETGITDLALPGNLFQPMADAKLWSYQIGQIEIPKATLAIRLVTDGWTISAASTAGVRYQLVTASVANQGIPIAQWNPVGIPKDGTGSVIEWAGQVLIDGQVFALRSVK